MAFFLKRSVFLLILFINISAAHATTIICVAGGTGAGKTTIANKIKAQVGDSAAIISQDSYYKDLSHMTIEERGKVNFDHPDSIEFSLLKKHLLQLKNGESIEVPIYDFTTSNRTGKTKTLLPKDIIILEGILVLAVPEIHDILDIKLYVEVEDDERLLRRIKRDIEERGRTIENVRKQYLATVKPMHQKFVAPSKKFANLIIPYDSENIVAVDLLVTELRKKIAGRQYAAK
ncbi:uridine kinase [Rickettsiaceae bacterium]|nr:uridine kinase [Rickettsiaceae bacterium]